MCLSWGRINYLSFQTSQYTQDITSASERKTETSTSLPIRMDDATSRTIVSPPSLTLNTHVLISEGTQSLHERSFVIFGILQSWNKVIATFTHPHDLRAV
jgi:hypothetical protein